MRGRARADVGAPALPGTLPGTAALALAWSPLGVLVGVTLTQVGGGYAGGANGPYIVVLADELGVAPSSLGWIASAFGFALLPVAAFGRRLLRIGAHRLLRFSAALGALSAVVLAATPGIVPVAVAAAAAGISGALNLLASTTLLRGSAGKVSLVMAFASLSGLLAPLAIGGLELLGSSGGWGLLLPVPLLAAVAVLGVATPPADVPSAAEGPAEPRGGAAPLAVMAAWLVLVTAVTAEFCFFIWGVARLVDAGLSTGLGSIVGIAFPLGMVLGRFAGARLTDAAMDTVRSRLRVTAAVTALATVGVVVGPLPLVVTGLVVAGLALSTSYPNALALLVSVPGLRLRTATSLGAAASGVAIIAAPLGLAAVAGLVDLRLAFLLPLPIVLLMAVAALPVWSRSAGEDLARR